MKGAKVLLVDDEKGFTETLSERLQLRDITVYTASSGQEAIVVQSDDPERRFHADGVRSAGVGGLFPHGSGKGHPDHVTRAYPGCGGVRGLYQGYCGD